MPQRGPLLEPANIVRDLEQADRDRLQHGRSLRPTASFAALRFEMIFASRNAIPVRCSRWRITFPGKFEVAIQPGADGGAAEREFLQNGDRLLARARVA